jgi:hypothetical protein
MPTADLLASLEKQNALLDSIARTLAEVRSSRPDTYRDLLDRLAKRDE